MSLLSNWLCKILQDPVEVRRAARVQTFYFKSIRTPIPRDHVELPVRKFQRSFLESFVRFVLNLHLSKDIIAILPVCVLLVCTYRGSVCSPLHLADTNFPGDSTAPLSLWVCSFIKLWQFLIPWRVGPHPTGINMYYLSLHYLHHQHNLHLHLRGHSPSYHSPGSCLVCGTDVLMCSSLHLGDTKWLSCHALPLIWVCSLIQLWRFPFNFLPHGRLYRHQCPLPSHPHYLPRFKSHRELPTTLERCGCLGMSSHPFPFLR